MSRYVAAVRTQMALASNFAHDPTIEREELKKRVHLPAAGRALRRMAAHTRARSIPPAVTLPDPVAVKKWGAMVAFFERAFEWENLMYTYYPYFWGRQAQVGRADPHPGHWTLSSRPSSRRARRGS